jgi:hypothetical protein
MRLSVDDRVGALQVYAVTQALFEMYEKFRQGLAPRLCIATWPGLRVGCRGQGPSMEQLS